MKQHYLIQGLLLTQVHQKLAYSTDATQAVVGEAEDKTSTDPNVGWG